MTTTQQTARQMGGGGATPNPKKLMKELKKHYLRAFLALIKAYKRYYLGVWIIKLPFYKLTSNQHKFTKWQAKRDERLEFLHNVLQHFKNVKKFFKTYYKDSKKWLNSPEFKAKYLDTKHPYPPLLNPDSVDYKSIPAELAWELNLPLPPNYDLIYFTNGASASAHICQFFIHCGLKIFPHWIGTGKTDFKEKYILHYNLILSKINYFNVVIVCVFATHDSKLFYLLSKSVPLLYIARDPISRMKSVCNHEAGIAIQPQVRNLNLSKTNFATLIPKVQYYCVGASIVDKPQVKAAFGYERLYHLMCFDSFLAKMPYLSKKYIFDFDCFTPQRTFETFKEIARIFSLNMPQDERLFNTRAEKARFGLGVLPISFKHDGIEIHISADSNVISDEIIELTDTILGSAHYFINDSEIIIYATKNNAKQLKAHDDFVQIKTYLRDYINALENNVKITLKSLISESQVLTYLKNNNEKRKEIKQFFDKELGFLKENFPQIVESWKYYNEFEKICAELDKKE